VRDKLAIDSRQQMSRMGVMGAMNQKRVKSYNPETVRGGTGTISSASKLLR
jgi:hypothetical protein